MNKGKDVHLAGLYTAGSLLVGAGRDRQPGAPLNMPPVLASNFVLGTERAYARDDGTIGAAATQDVFDSTVEIRAGGLADATANHDDVLNQPQLSKHSLELSSDLRQLFLIAPEQRDGLVSRFVFGHSAPPIRISCLSTRASVVDQPFRASLGLVVVRRPSWLSR